MKTVEDGPQPGDTVRLRLPATPAAPAYDGEAIVTEGHGGDSVLALAFTFEGEDATVLAYPEGDAPEGLATWAPIP